MNNKFKQKIAAAALAAGMIAFAGVARADQVVVDDGSTVVVTHHHPVVTHTIDEHAWRMCLDHNGDYSVNGCYISDRNERIRMMEEQNYNFKYRAHEAGVYDRD